MQNTMIVEEYATPCTVVANPSTSVKLLAEMMEGQGVRHVPVLKEDKPVGIVSDRDVKTIVNFNDFSVFSAKDIMTEEPYVVSADSPLEEVAMAMSEQKIGSAIVKYSEDGAIGIFTGRIDSHFYQ